MKNATREKEVDEVLRIKSTTGAKKISSSIAYLYFKGYKKIYLRAVGAGALAQMVYGVIIAETRLSSKNINFSYKHYYKDIVDNAEEKQITAIEYELIFK